MSKKSKALHGVIQLFLILFLLLYLSPLFLVGINAFKSYQEIMTDVMSLPSAFTLDNIKKELHNMKYPAPFLNTLIDTVIGTLGFIVIASVGVYKMAREKTRYSRCCFLFCIEPMMIPFQSFMLTLVNVATTVHINGKIWGLAIIYWGLGAPMSIFLYQGFAKGIPLELEESALIDGCNQFQLFTRIIFPMLKSCTATVTIINVMWIWNDFLLPYLVLDLNEYKTISIAIQYMKGSYGRVDMGAIMAALILAVIPVIIFYLSCQKHIIKGVAAGAVKG